MENKPGNGKDSPFGNGQGATSAGASKGGHDFVKEPTSNVGGGHDFVRDPKATVTGPKPADMVKDPGGSASSAPAQQSGPPPTLCPSSVPAGGRLPFKGDPKPTESGGKPFKI